MKLVVVLLIICCACAGDQTGTVKVGGDQRIVADDIINRYTVQIKLFVKHSGNLASGNCSGTLLSANKVLTAAHCVDGNLWRAKVLIGFDNPIKTVTGKQFSVVAEGMSFVANANYLRRKNKLVGQLVWSKVIFSQPRVKMGDLAVIKLAKNIDLPYPIDFTVPDATVDLTGEQVTIAGYGIGDFGQQPGLARRANVVINRDYQRSDLLEFTNYLNSMSPGDSGGPVWWWNNAGELQLIGVHSFMFSYFRYYTYSVDVRQHQRWLNRAQQLLDNPDLVINKGTNFFYHSYLPGYLEDHHRTTRQDNHQPVTD